MLLLVVLSMAAVFCPALSQPTRRLDIFEASDYPMRIYRDRNELGEGVERPYKDIDSGNLLRDLEALKLFSQNIQPRNGQLGEHLGLQLPKPNRKLGGFRFADKRNFDEIDRSGFNGFIKRNFDEIDRSGFNSLVKKNFDEIDRSAFNGFV